MHTFRPSSPTLLRTLSQTLHVQPGSQSWINLIKCHKYLLNSEYSTEWS